MNLRLRRLTQKFTLWRSIGLRRSVLYLYFLIAFNSKPADLPRLAVIFGRRQLDAFLFLFDIARFQHTGGGLFYLAAFPHHKQR